jgi:ABC-type sugar transport system substrate-binding protein
VRTRSFTVAAAIALTGALVACGSDDKSSTSSTGSAATTQSSKAPAKLGLITKFPVDFYLAMKSAAQKWDTANQGATVTYGTGKSATDDQGQIDLIQSMVTQGVKGIAITPSSPAVAPALDAAVAKGVKVVLLDNDLPDWNKKSSVVATDNLKGGVLAGQFLAKSLKQGATVAVLEGVPGVPALDDRVKGMEQGLGSSGVKVVGKAPTDCDQDKGVSAAADLLTAHPDVDAIYGACGPPTLGAIQSIQRAGRKPDGILLVGFDALPDEVKQIQAGKEDATVAQFPAKMGELGLGTLLRAVKGEKVAPTVDTGTAIVSKDNASDF